MLSQAQHRAFARAVQKSQQTTALKSFQAVHFRQLAIMSNMLSHKNGDVPARDFLEIIKLEHDNVRDFQQRAHKAFEAKDYDTFTMVSNSVLRAASLHSDSEELSVYKALEEHGLKEFADKDRAEHQEVKQLMSKLEHSTITTNGAEEVFKMFNDAVDLFLKHAEDEESKDAVGSLVQLREKVDQERANEIGDQFLDARSKVSERPHPNAPQTGGSAQRLATMMSKPMDMLMQMGRKFAEPKHDFPSIK